MCSDCLPDAVIRATCDKQTIVAPDSYPERVNIYMPSKVSIIKHLYEDA